MAAFFVLLVLTVCSFGGTYLIIKAIEKVTEEADDV